MTGLCKSDCARGIVTRGTYDDARPLPSLGDGYRDVQAAEHS